MDSWALPDITSNPEVRQIFKIRTVRKPDVFLPGRRTVNPLENRKKKIKLLKIYISALPDITSGPEVRQIFKIQTVRKPDVFLPGRRTFNT